MLLTYANNSAVWQVDVTISGKSWYRGGLAGRK